MVVVVVGVDVIVVVNVGIVGNGLNGGNGITGGIGTTGTCGTATGSDFSVGAAPNGTLPWSGKIAEILYVDGVLDATARAQLAAYADARYSL